MKIRNISSTSVGLFPLQNQEFLNNQKVAGKIAAQCLNYLQNEIHNLTNKTGLQLSKEVEQIILDNGCTPTFQNYKGFSGVFCISINQELVHGIPKDVSFKSGDLISFDLGVTYKESIADTALTIIYGQAKNPIDQKLIDVTEECLYKAIKSIKIGKRLGSIGNAIFKCAKNYDFKVIVNYGGHGIGLDEKGMGVAHAPPFIANKSDSNEGIIIQEGLVIAIEPLLSLKCNETKIMNDGWTVEMIDGNLGCHFEHSLFVHKDHVEVVTYRGNEKYLKSNKIYFND
jgi:methionyl aminopeptidase